jgi:hypothetical protein
VDAFRAHAAAAIPRPTATPRPITGRNDGARMRSLDTATVNAT